MNVYRNATTPKKYMSIRYFILCVVLVTSNAVAKIRNDVPSCYAAYKINAPTNNGMSSRELFVVVDGTFEPDEKLKRHVYSKIVNMLRPSDSVSFISFSTYIDDKYTNLQFAGKYEALLSKQQRNSISKRTLKKFDRCMEKQRNFIKSGIGNALNRSFKTEGEEIPYSEIVGNLSTVVSTLVSVSNSPKKTMLLVSDMLENSEITTFYSRGNLRVINAENEISKIEKANMFARLENVNIYVVGGAWKAPTTRDGMRASTAIKALGDFWRLYFGRSGAELVELGQPHLINELE